MPFVRRVAASLLVLTALAGMAHAEPSFFTNRCASCHSNDTPTCNGCHEHRGNVQAHLNAAYYAPGDPLTVILTGGQEHGWIRGILYDHNDVVVALATGPTGTGDDGGTGDIVFPVSLEATAPTAAGDYIWEAAWFGGVSAGGGAHVELRRPVTVHVEIITGVPELPFDPEGGSWSTIKALY